MARFSGLPRPSQTKTRTGFPVRVRYPRTSAKGDLSSEARQLTIRPRNPRENEDGEAAGRDVRGPGSKPAAAGRRTPPEAARSKRRAPERNKPGPAGRPRPAPAAAPERTRPVGRVPRLSPGGPGEPAAGPNRPPEVGRNLRWQPPPPRPPAARRSPTPRHRHGHVHGHDPLAQAESTARK